MRRLTGVALAERRDRTPELLLRHRIVDFSSGKKVLLHIKREQRYKARMDANEYFHRLTCAVWWQLRSGGVLARLGAALVPPMPQCAPPAGFTSARATDVRSALLLLGLGLFLSALLAQCELEAVKDCRHQCDECVRGPQLNVFSEALYMWFMLVYVKTLLVHSAVIRITPDTFKIEALNTAPPPLRLH
ncbi:hypothetical protein EVAR_89053_1 [Eumeta japonica]|uniref:Uncharacterized protein n=1 Tax=Eumeta variegata TaxID=151549 RepID=A0A4C1XJB4_EUMVA|nr:hypothetical protein EVAR_89053_1 [Eumeta japonica]